jgi:hypothetical protein
MEHRSIDTWLGKLEGLQLPGTLRDSKRVLCKWSIYLYVSSVRGTRRNSPFTGNSESYTRHVKEGFGMAASLYL